LRMMVQMAMAPPTTEATTMMMMMVDLPIPDDSSFFLSASA